MKITKNTFEKLKNTPKILGLDISTKVIGFALFDITGSKLLELTHFSPKIKPQPEDKLEELIKKADAFKDHLEGYRDMGRIIRLPDAGQRKRIRTCRQKETLVYPFPAPVHDCRGHRGRTAGY
jgi:hypothetical protein